MTFTIEDYQSIAKQKNYTYILNTIPKNTSTQTNGWQCINNHISNISYSNFCTRKTCPQCTGKNVKNISDYISVADNNGIKYLLTTIPAHTNDVAINAWSCLICDNIWSTSFTKISSAGSGCPNCSKNNLRHSINDYLLLGQKFGLILPNGNQSLIPTDANTECIWKCITHPDFTITLSYHRLDNVKNTLCNHCSQLGIKPNFDQIILPPIEIIPLSPDESKTISKSTHKLKIDECITILTRMKMDTIGTRDILRKKIKDTLAKQKLVTNNDKNDTNIQTNDIKKEEKNNEQNLVLSQKIGFKLMIENNMIDANQLAKDTNSRLDNYLASKKTQAFIHALSELPKYKGVSFVTTKEGKNGGTRFHRLVAYHFATMMSPTFAAYVVQLLDNVFLTGQVKLGEEKSSSELDKIWEEKCEKLQNQINNQTKLLEQKDERIEEEHLHVIKLKKSLANYEKKHTHVKFNVTEPTYYLFDYGALCNDGCRLKNFNKHGITIKKGENGNKYLTLDGRLRTHRTTFPMLRLNFAVTAPEFFIIMIEKIMEEKYGIQLNPSNHELFESLDVINDIKKTVINFLENMCPGKYKIIEQELIDKYNEDISLTIKEESKIINNINNSTTNNNNSTTNNDNSTINNNTHIHIEVDLEELKILLKELSGFKIKKLDEYLEKFKIAKHGDKLKKMDKLKKYINSKMK
jgi:hypothetical protein